MHPLPGLDVGEVDADRPARDVVAEYYGRYERDFSLPAHRPVQVREVRDGGDGRLLVRTDAASGPRAGW